MDIRQLPDLSDWRFVEVWTLEEAAMLWAAIDPMAHQGERLAELAHQIDQTQHKKALLFLRAAIEAVCAGTLSFTEAWEEFDDPMNGIWSKKVDFPDTPNPIHILPHMTRVQQAAFLKWAQNKRIPSFRQSLRNARTTDVHHAKAVATLVPKPQQETVLLLAKPSPLDKDHPCHAVELRAGFEAWEAVVSTGEHEAGKSPKAAVMAVLDAHPEYSKLSNEAKTRISTVANWNKGGGATKTPTRANLPTPKE